MRQRVYEITIQFKPEKQSDIHTLADLLEEFFFNGYGLSNMETSLRVFQKLVWEPSADSEAEASEMRDVKWSYTTTGNIVTQVDFEEEKNDGHERIS